jgi:hypothetical protein
MWVWSRIGRALPCLLEVIFNFFGMSKIGIPQNGRRQPFFKVALPVGRWCSDTNSAQEGLSTYCPFALHQFGAP